MGFSMNLFQGQKVQMTQSNQRLLDILSFWHKVEFFIPFDLDNRAREQTNQKKLWRAYGQTSELKCDDVVLSRLRSGLSTHLGSLSFEGQGAFAT
ncbi:hypothetical protein ROLI_032810 [Roseobacter fucihabitans]|uniref:Uncharacterized protein n=1 Tax=Roseobacter fucihabitans TaxID=1537242 RepID=A0ABZ2BYB4_9RHOB